MIDPALKKGHHKLYRYDGQHFSLAVSSRRAFPPPPPHPRWSPQTEANGGGPPIPATWPTVSQGSPLSLEWDWCLETGAGGGSAPAPGEGASLPY